MEQSKLISVIIAKLKVAYPSYFEKYNDEEFLGLVSLYQETFIDCNPNALLLTIKKIIKTSKFMPSIAEILDVYRREAKNYYFNILDKADIDDDKKSYLKSMADWYSYQEEYPSEILKQLNEVEKKVLMSSKNKNKLLGGKE